MKGSLLSIILFLLFINGSAQKWIVESKSKIDIEVPSTITTTQCSLDTYTSKDTLEITTNENYSSLKGTLHISVHILDCHQSLITKEMKRTLKADSFPDLRITLSPSSHFRLNIHTAQFINDIVSIEMGGVTNHFNLDYSVTAVSYNNIELNGSKKIRLSDYGLKAPSKLGGLIKVYDEVRVSFHLFLKRIDSFDLTEN